MRPTLTLLIACGLVLSAASAPGAEENRFAREQAHHRLLKLELQKAQQHARTLHFQAHDRAQALDPEILGKHAEHLGWSLDEIEVEVLAIQEIDGEERFDFQVAEIHNHAALAKEGGDQLRLEATKPVPDRNHVDRWSAIIFDHMTKAIAHHRKAMAAHRIVEPPRPTVDG
jgi:hypothetical protein